MAPLQTVVSYRLATLIAFLLFALVAPSAQAAVILQVDVSDPSAVVFTATDALAENTVVDANDNRINLFEFFSEQTGPVNIFPNVGAVNAFDSTAGTTRSPLDRISVSSFVRNLEIYGGVFFDMNFLDTQRALTGSLTADLDTFAISGIPTPGTSGNVLAGGLGSLNIIGQYQVVPEPGTAALLGLGLAGLGVARRSRREERERTA